MSCVQIVPPTALLSLDEAKRQVRRTDDNDDDLFLTALIAVVSEALEGGDGDTRRSVMPQTWELRLDADAWLPTRRGGCDDVWAAVAWGERCRWPCGVSPVLLPYPPVIAIESVAYFDETGAPQVIADFQVVGSLRDGPMILPANGTSWPSTSLTPECIRIRYRAGFVKLAADGTPALDADGNMQPAPPARLKQAALLHLAHLYEYRSASVSVGAAVTLPMGYDALVSKFRSPRL